MLGWGSAGGVEWARLVHAYGMATDTPGQLRALVGDAPDAQREAWEHLDSAVLHQGTLFPVTPPVVRVVAGLLDAPALRRPDADGRPVLASVVAWLGWVGESAAQFEPDPDLPQPSASEAEAWYRLLDDDDEEEAWSLPVVDSVFNAALRDVRGLVPDLFEVLLPLVDDADPAVRSEAAGALARWGLLPVAETYLAQTVQRLRAPTRCRLRTRRAGGSRAGLGAVGG